MIIRDTYNALLNKELTIDNIHEINEFKKLCKRQNNHEYYYLSNILIIDIYIEENQYEEALQIALRDINNVDSNIFKNIYLYLLERIIYIYIQKNNYKSAYRYVYRKRNVIDLDNKEEVNRWYLEMAYVYAELYELNRALLNLQAILENYPNDEIKSVTLSNMTKIYIDQGMIKEAKETLNQCLELVIKLDDHEGKIYCDYLLAKIYTSEKNYKFAKKIYDDIFKNKDDLPLDYLNLVNEYIHLLINMNLYKEATDVVNQYETLFENSNIYIKKEFYKNKVKLAIYKNGSTIGELDKIIKMIDILDDEISHNKELVLNEAAEDEKIEEIQQSLKSTISKLEKTINLLTFALKHDNERASLMDFSKRLEEVIVFDEALYVILDRPDNDILPNLFDSYSQFTSYQYKKDRLYERNHSFQSLENTPIEYIMQNSKEIIIDFGESNIPIRDLISTRNYNDLKVKSLIALPLFHGQELFGAAVFLSRSDLTAHENILILKIATQLLEFKLSSLFYQESLRSQRNILQQAINGLQEGLFYFDPNKEKFFLTERLQDFLRIDKKLLSVKEYHSLIHNNDLKRYQTIVSDALQKGDAYDIKYRLLIDGNLIKIHERSSPYITVEGNIKFYVGTINKISNLEKDEDDLFFNYHEFLNRYKEIEKQINNPEYKFSLVRLKIKNLDEINLPINKLINEVTKQTIFDFELAENIYSLEDDTLIFIIENCIDQRVLDRYIKNNIRNLDNLQVDNRVYNLNVAYSVSRYPRDSVSFERILDISSMILELDNNNFYYNDQTSESFVHKTMINNNYIKYLNNSLDLLLQPIIQFKELLGYKIAHNVKGLDISVDYRSQLDDKIIKTLAQETINKVYSYLRGVHQKYFIMVSGNSLQELLDSRFLRFNPLNQYITLVVDKPIKSEKQMAIVLEKLISLDFKIALDFTVVINYSLEFVKKFANTIWFNHEDYSELNAYKDILELISTTLIIPKENKDYPKAYFLDGQYLQINQINRGQ